MRQRSEMGRVPNRFFVLHRVGEDSTGCGWLVCWGVGRYRPRTCATAGQPPKEPDTGKPNFAEQLARARRLLLVAY